MPRERDPTGNFRSRVIRARGQVLASTSLALKTSLISHYRRCHRFSRRRHRSPFRSLLVLRAIESPLTGLSRRTISHELTRGRIDGSRARAPCDRLIDFRCHHSPVNYARLGPRSAAAIINLKSAGVSAPPEFPLRVNKTD